MSAEDLLKIQQVANSYGSAGEPSRATSAYPLCVDLDGTLLRTDLLFESMLATLKKRPWLLFAIPFWLFRGKAFVKRKFAERAEINPATLPYDTQLLAWLSSERGLGRRLVLCTASEDTLARPIARHLELFDEVMATHDLLNLSGAAKRDALVERFGAQGFDYAGDSAVDLAVWSRCHAAIVVNAPSGVVGAAQNIAQVERVFRRNSALRPKVSRWGRVLRVHQWTKNLLVFVPLVTSHRLFEAHLFVNALLMVAALCLCASGAYVMNDLLDLEADRIHPSKRFRPFADGSCSVRLGLALIPLLTLGGFALALPLGAPSVSILAAYLLGTLIYSWALKKLVLVDVFILSMLYTLRVGAGLVATSIPYSPWLLSFCIFIFLSLAFSKRFSELQNLEALSTTKVAGRGYQTVDRQQVNIFGVASGFLAALVLTLYIDSPAVTMLYRHPAYLWLLCPLLLYWISRIWLLAGRGALTEDPIMFAGTDRVTWAVILIAGLVIILGTHDWIPSL